MILFKQTVDTSLLVIGPAQSGRFSDPVLELNSRQELLSPPQFFCCSTFLIDEDHFSELHLFNDYNSVAIFRLNIYTGIIIYSPQPFTC